jgi:hypothetical protein
LEIEKGCEPKGRSPFFLFLFETAWIGAPGFATAASALRSSQAYFATGFAGAALAFLAFFLAIVDSPSERFALAGVVPSYT